MAAVGLRTALLPLSVFGEILSEEAQGQKGTHHDSAPCFHRRAAIRCDKPHPVRPLGNRCDCLKERLLRRCSDELRTQEPPHSLHEAKEYVAPGNRAGGSASPRTLSSRFTDLRQWH